MSRTSMQIGFKRLMTVTGYESRTKTKLEMNSCLNVFEIMDTLCVLLIDKVLGKSITREKPRAAFLFSK